MDREAIQREIAYLESANDHLYTEMQEIDRLLKLGGFPGGLATLMETAEEMLEEEREDEFM